MIPAATTSPLWGVGVVTLFVAGMLAARTTGVPTSLNRLLDLADHRGAAWCIGILTGLVFFWLGGSTLHVPAMITDEQAYLLQAQIFARLHWTAPTPVLPEFFAQAYVLFHPAIAAKYPPGQALVLTPGVMLGLPWLVPCLLNAITGSLVFTLARRVAGGPVALLTWALWIACGSNLAWRVSYFSEITTTALCLAGWWFALNWRANGSRLWLVLLGATIGGGAITRPYTMLLYTLPLAAVLVVHAWRTRRLASVAWTAVVAVAVLAILPIWAWRSTGSGRVTPLQRYTATYMPYDRLGFAHDESAPDSTLPADQRAVLSNLRAVHAGHTVAALPATIADRAGRIANGAWNGWRILFGLLAIAGITGLGGAEALTVVTCLVIFAGYLFWGHEPTWTLYYLEVMPVLAFLGARGAWTVLRHLGGTTSGARLALIVAMPLIVMLSVREVVNVRTIWRGVLAPRQRLAARVGDAPGSRKVIFVRYAPDHFVHSSLIANDPWFASSRVWYAYDRGDQDTLLLKAATGRTPYLYDEKSGVLAAIQWAGGTR